MTKKNNMDDLKKVRKDIDNIDNKIIKLIGDRFGIIDCFLAIDVWFYSSSILNS